MAVTRLEFTYTKNDLFEIVDSWAHTNGYKELSRGEHSRLFQRGSTFGFSAPSRVEIQLNNDHVTLDCWLEAFGGVSRMDINPGFVGALPKSITRKKIDGLLQRLGQEPIGKTTPVVEVAGKGQSKNFIGNFFRKIATKKEAEVVIVDVAKGFYFLAGLQALLGFLVIGSPVALIDGVLYAVFAFLLQKFKSRVVAVILLVLSIITLFTTLSNAVGQSYGGTNMILAVVVVVMGVRSVQATFALTSLPKESTTTQ